MIARPRDQAFESRLYEPTPGEIQRACQQIQATWSPRERKKRYRGQSALWWLPPTIRLAGLIAAFDDEQDERLSYY